MALNRTIHRSLPTVLRRLGVRVSCSVPAVLACLVATCVTLSACSSVPADAAQSEAPSPASPASSPSAPDPRPTAASSNGPARNAPKPELPESAKTNTKEGFAAFTQYWFDTITYALATNNPDAIRAVSKPDCGVCNVYVAEAQAAKDANGWADGPSWTVHEFTTNMSRDHLDRTLGWFLLDESASVKYDSSGNVLRARKGGNDGNPKEIYGVYQDGRWFTAQAGQS
ncbi:DUF6318 family protein [Sinomonas albida]|uniref:DUF6318 family protein n=1 Tax=Sinomonas albida TaxID=369942 RepID=UPI00301769E5